MGSGDRDRLALNRFDIARYRTAQRKILHPEEQRSALGGDLFAELVGQLNDQARTLAAHRAELEISEDRAQIALQLIDEAPLVAPLERDFVVSSNQVTHRDRLHPQALFLARIIVFARQH
jgi:hypothetical protein